MDDLSFLDQPSATGRYSNAILRVVLSNGQVSQVSDRINPYELLVPCPLLFHAFEDGYDSRVQANIEAPSTAAAVMLLRYCYTGSYLPSDFEFLPISFLPHAEIYKMAEDFDIPELQLLAYGNFTCQFEFASSLPEPPIDLPETIRFVYMHYSSNQARQQQDLIKTVLHFCVSAFVKLSRNNDFLEVFRQVPQFRQDLCLTNMEREFADDCKQAIWPFTFRTNFLKVHLISFSSHSVPWSLALQLAQLFSLLGTFLRRCSSISLKRLPSVLPCINPLLVQ